MIFYSLISKFTYSAINQLLGGLNMLLIVLSTADNLGDQFVINICCHQVSQLTQVNQSLECVFLKEFQKVLAYLARQTLLIVYEFDIFLSFCLLLSSIHLIKNTLLLRFYLLGKHELRLPQSLIGSTVFLELSIFIFFDYLNSCSFEALSDKYLQDWFRFKIKVKKLLTVPKQCRFV